MDILAFGRDNGDMVLSVDDERVRRELPDGRVEEVRWDALKKVEILSTAEGPLLEDVFALPCLHTYHRSCIATWLERSQSCQLPYPNSKHRIEGKCVHVIY